MPLFDAVTLDLNGERLTISGKGSGPKISEITYDRRKVAGYFVAHHDLVKWKQLVIQTEGRSASATKVDTATTPVLEQPD